MSYLRSDQRTSTAGGVWTGLAMLPAAAVTGEVSLNVSARLNADDPTALVVAA